MDNQQSDKSWESNQRDSEKKQSGSFKEDPQRASREGRKGGEASRGRSRS